jgi:hypothetical protein
LRDPSIRRGGFRLALAEGLWQKMKRGSAETVDNVYEMGTDTFVVRDGKIVAQSFTGKVTPKD